MHGGAPCTHKHINTVAGGGNAAYQVLYKQQISVGPVMKVK